jgi:hypothetical protein
MWARSRSRRTLALVTASALIILTGPALANPEAAREDSSTSMLAWFGCWRLEAVGAEDVAESDGESQVLCVEAGDAPRSLRFSAIADDEVVAEEVLVVDGEQQPVSEGGCSGWKRSTLSNDQRRLFLASEMTCEGGRQNSLSGTSLILSGGRWVDINVIRVGSERELVVRRYRRADAKLPSKRADGAPMHTVRLPGTLPAASEIARVDAAAPLSEQDVIEALEHVDPAVVEAMLTERRSAFPMNGRLLLRLDDAGVPGEIIDLMMALSYPAYFAVDDQSVATRAASYNRSWGAWPYGHGYWYDYRYGYGHYYGDHDNHDDHDDSNSRQTGLAISGAGYTRVRPTKLPGGGVFPIGTGNPSSGGTGSTGSTGGVSSGPTSGSNNNASGSGYQSSGSGSRKARAR